MDKQIPNNIIGTFILENVFSNRLFEKMTSNKFVPGDSRHESKRIKITLISIIVFSIFIGVCGIIASESIPLIKYFVLLLLILNFCVFVATTIAALSKLDSLRTTSIYEPANKKKLDEKRKKRLAAELEKKSLGASEISNKKERRTGRSKHQG